VFANDTTTRRCVSADSNGPLVTVRSSSEHGPDASGVNGLVAGAGLAEGVAVTVTIGGADEVAAAEGDFAAGMPGWAEHPAIRTTATNGRISFISNSYKHGLMTGPGGPTTQSLRRTS
jgi:hypothetical protein